ncbi:MAG: hypothetical protein EOO41_00335 [Methanobacteriota archaeon]|nr:MAG: hypothetical protein EOO41_00335 [Euryarchaeota archaeon]
MRRRCWLMKSLAATWQTSSTPSAARCVLRSSVCHPRCVFSRVRACACTLVRLVCRTALQMILTMTGPYSRMRLSHIAETLGVATEEVEPLLVGLILDGRLLGQIDQLAGILTLHAAAGSDTSPSGPVSATVDATHKALLALRDAVQKLNA